MAINGIKREDVETFQRSLTQVDWDNALDTYQDVAGSSAIYPGQGTPLGLAYVALKLNGEAGEFAEHVGKAMRDDHLAQGIEYNEFGQIHGNYVQLTPDRRKALIKEIGDVLWYCQAACRELGISLSDAALGNLEKLCDRGERGQLQGSGDER